MISASALRFAIIPRNEGYAPPATLSGVVADEENRLEFWKNFPNLS